MRRRVQTIGREKMIVSNNLLYDRRTYLKTSLSLTAATSGLVLIPYSAHASEPRTSYVVGPMEGYSPQIGTLVSMLTYMRGVVLASLPGLNQKDLDYLFDSKANTIGALLSH